MDFWDDFQGGKSFQVATNLNALCVFTFMARKGIQVFCISITTHLNWVNYNDLNIESNNLEFNAWKHLLRARAVAPLLRVLMQRFSWPNFNFLALKYNKIWKSLNIFSFLYFILEKYMYYIFYIYIYSYSVYIAINLAISVRLNVINSAFTETKGPKDTYTWNSVYILILRLIVAYLSLPC